MPIWLQYIDFSMGVIGFFITLITLKTAYSVKKQLVHVAELSEFRNNIENLIQEIEGYIASINDDQLYTTDNAQTLNKALTQLLTDIQSRFSFLSKRTNRLIKGAFDLLKNPNMLPSDWSVLALQLIKIKNQLRKEHNSYE